MQNHILVNNSNPDLRAFDAELGACVVNNLPVPEELTEFVTLKVMVGYNPNGSNRGVLERAA